MPINCKHLRIMINETNSKYYVEEICEKIIKNIVHVDGFLFIDFLFFFSRSTKN